MSAAEFPSLPTALNAVKGRIGLILGSGLGGAVEKLDIAAKYSYDSIDGLPSSTVPGHSGKLISGELAGVPVLVAQGRIHLYEGRTPQQATALIRLFHTCGVEKVLLTNAAGAICSDFKVGNWMMIRDHLNLTGTSPLLGGPNFVDLTTAYSTRLAALFSRTASELGIVMHEGVYAGLLGPQYETPAEIRMLRALGADAVGMSTVLETIQARALGMEVAAFSCLTNWGAGIGGASLHHGEVMETGKKAAQALITLLESALPKIAD